jgi:hypothetical protein
MAITNLSQLIAAFPTKQVFFPVKYGTSNQAIAGTWNSSWRMTGSNLADMPDTGSGEAHDGTTLGRLMLQNAQSGKQLYLSRFIFSPTVIVGCYMMDRLVSNSGLSGTATGVQTINSVALPARAGTGVGCELWIEWYASTGSTARTLTVIYTNSDGTTGRTTSISVAASFKLTGCMRVPLQAGDKGIRSVQSVQWNGSTGTAGNFGITICQRIATIDNSLANSMTSMGPIRANLPEVSNDSCIYFILNSLSTTSASFDIEVTFIEG